MLDELLFFEVPILTTPPLPLETPRSSSPSSSLIEFDNRGPVQHPEDSQSEDISSSSVCQCPSHVQGENYFELPGYHPEIPTDDTRRRKVRADNAMHINAKGWDRHHRIRVDCIRDVYCTLQDLYMYAHRPVHVRTYVCMHVSMFVCVYILLNIWTKFQESYYLIKL